MRLEQMAAFLPRLFSMTRELDRAEREEEARQRAAWQQYLMAITAPSGQLGDGRLANLDDLKAAGLLEAGGLFWEHFTGRCSSSARKVIF
jgi:hypothetical protein